MAMENSVNDLDFVRWSMGFELSLVLFRENSRFCFKNPKTREKNHRRQKLNHPSTHEKFDEIENKKKEDEKSRETRQRQMLRGTNLMN